MTAIEKKARQAKNELARALARWENEGGAAARTKAVGQAISMDEPWNVGRLK